MIMNLLDQICLQIDCALRTLLPPVSAGRRPNPADTVAESPLTPSESRHAAGLMRINHVGEVCAQALYQGQAATARHPNIKAALQEAANEEQDHLLWCHERLTALDSHVSYLNPLWYAGALVLGMTAGLMGDRWSLGFLAETEKQVTEHLENHLIQLPAQDQKSRAIVYQIALDEKAHEEAAYRAGAYPLPAISKVLMKMSAGLMKKIAYFI